MCERHRLVGRELSELLVPYGSERVTSLGLDGGGGVHFGLGRARRLNCIRCRLPCLEEWQRTRSERRMRRVKLPKLRADEGGGTASGGGGGGACVFERVQLRDCRIQRLDRALHPPIHRSGVVGIAHDSRKRKSFRTS